jgi:hypothetical protein
MPAAIAKAMRRESGVERMCVDICWFLVLLLRFTADWLRPDESAAD